MKIIPDGGIIIDAGSNIGNHAVFFQHYFKPKKMYCFEPQQLAFDTLQRNIELNAKGGDVAAVQAMLGAQEGRGAVSTYKPGNQGGATFAPSEDGERPMTTLDSALKKTERAKVSFLKIDVEGFQAEVLRGADDILKSAKPVLWIEVFDNEKAKTDEVLAPYGYTSKPLSKNNYIYTAT